ncbi:hypothetical protein HZC53_02700 [Candidatus Uhrbacteria bacterium]|nr:hypothetical protein [Candidatus Uhrbacteria bacterium]
MEFPKPPPLKVKPPCPAVAHKWLGVEPRVVRLVVMVSIAFWTSLILGPLLLALAFSWHLLQDKLLLKVVAIVVIILAFYVGYSMGVWAANNIIFRGLIQKAVKGKIDKAEQL